MQSPAHFLVGAGICRHVRCRPLGLALAFASHFALDALPHFEDPSILPRPIGRVAGAHWDLILIAAQVVVVGLAIGTWHRLRRAKDATLSEAMYVIGGGLLACSPDYLYWLAGMGGPVRELNQWSHRWWFEPYLRYVRTFPGKRPIVAAWCLSIESLICLSGAVLLFGRSAPAPRAEIDAEQGAVP